MYRVAEDGSRQWVGWYDTVLNAECGWLRMSDGKDHCVPQYHGLAYVFADSACTRTVVTIDECYVGAAPSRAYGDKNPYACPRETSVFEIEPLAVGTQLYVISQGACIEYAIGFVSTERDFVIGAEVPPSEFVASDIVHGP